VVEYLAFRPVQSFLIEKHPRNGEAPKKERKSIDFIDKNSLPKRKMVRKIWSCFVVDSKAHI
jgi:hypothetical protein